MEMFSATFQNKAILPELPRSVQPNIRLSNDGFREIEQPQNKEVAGNTPNSFVSSFKLSNKNDIDPAKQSFSFASSPPMVSFIFFYFTTKQKQPCLEFSSAALVCHKNYNNTLQHLSYTYACFAYS